VHKLKKLVLALLVLAVVAVVLIFTLENQSPVSLVFLGYNLPNIPVSVLMVAALLIGALIGPALAVVLLWRGRYRHKRI